MSLHELSAMLKEAAAEIRALEQQAQKALEGGYDTSQHKAKLQAKCRLLMELPERAEPLAEDLTPEQQESVMNKLDNMAGRANSALQVDSVFFMAQLLYPDDYQDGDQTELERFADQTAAM